MPPGRQPRLAPAKRSLMNSIVRGNTRFDQKSPADGLVLDIYSQQGDQVVAGQPVVSILPMDSVKIRFFVPERQLAALHVGQNVGIDCSGCPPSLAATIRYISQNAEFTARLPHSETTSRKMAYMVEAWPRPSDALRLHPGQPVNVSLGISE
jgi:HlyD family secretion protein